MSTPYGYNPPSPGGPAIGAYVVTPADLDPNTPQYMKTTKALYVGQGGDLSVVMYEGLNTVVFRNLPSGYILPIRAVNVNLTGTTASSILGLF